jgi:hypothetical protein
LGDESASPDIQEAGEITDSNTIDSGEEGGMG